MSKLLLKNNNVMEFVDKEKNVLVVGSDMILTPGAKDILRNNDIRISYGEIINKKEKDEVNSKNTDSKKNVNGHLDSTVKEAMEDMSLENQIKLLIRKEFNIAREADVQKISKAVMEVIRERGQGHDD